MKMQWRRTSRKGFSLVEVLIALVILSVGIMVIAQMQSVAIGGLARSRHLTSATQIAISHMEFLRSLPFNDNDVTAQQSPPIVNGAAWVDGAGDSVLLDESVGDGTFGGWRYYQAPRDELMNAKTNKVGTGMNFYMRWRLNRGGPGGTAKAGGQEIGFPGAGQMVIHVQVFWWETNEPTTVDIRTAGNGTDHNRHRVELYSTRQQSF